MAKHANHLTLLEIKQIVEWEREQFATIKENKMEDPISYNDCPLSPDKINHYLHCITCLRSVLAEKIAIAAESLPKSVGEVSNQANDMQIAKILKKLAQIQKEKKPKKMQILAVAASFFLVIASAITIWKWQDEKHTSTAQIANAKLVFVKGKVFVNGSPVKAGKTLQESDTLETKVKSKAVISLEKRAAITIFSKTSITISSLLKQPNGKLSVLWQQKLGKSQHDILPNSGDYRVATPTAVAGVRGTSFSVRTSNKKEIIRVLRGKVAYRRKMNKSEEKSVSNNKKQTETIVESGQKLIAKPNNKKETKQAKTQTEVLFLKNLSQKEKKAMAKNTFSAVKQIQIFEKAQQVENTHQNTNASQSVSDKNMKEKTKNWLTVLEKQARNINKANTKEKKLTTSQQKLTLEDLRKKYGKLSIIQTRSGKVYKGAFAQNGNKLVIHTITGKVKVPIQEIAKIRPLP